MSGLAGLMAVLMQQGLHASLAILPLPPLLPGKRLQDGEEFNRLQQAMSRMGTLPCRPTSGTNDVVLEAYYNALPEPQIGNFTALDFVPQSTSTAAVTIKLDGFTSPLKAFYSDGVTQLSAGGLTAGLLASFAYNAALDSGHGGWVLQNGLPIATKNLQPFMNRAAVQAWNFQSAPPGAILLLGYSSPGDFGCQVSAVVCTNGGLVAPGHLGYVQSADGIYWIYQTTKPTLNMFGGKTNSIDFTFDNTPALNAAQAYCIANAYTDIWAKAGVWTFRSKPNNFACGLHLRGEGFSSSFYQGGTHFYRNFSQGAGEFFLGWDGTAVAFNSTGGGCHGIDVMAAFGTSGGIAMGGVCQDDTNRPGYMQWENILIRAEGGGAWNVCWKGDGSACVTSNAQGFRDNGFLNFFCSGASNEIMQLVNCTNTNFTNVQAFGAGGAATVVRISGASSAANSKSTNMTGTIVCTELILDNCDQIHLSGLVFTTITYTANATNWSFTGNALNGINGPGYPATPAGSPLILSPSAWDWVAATPGKINLPGIQVRWGVFTSSDVGDGATAVNFSYPFDNDCFMVLVCPATNSGGAAGILHAATAYDGSYTKTGFTGYCKADTGGAPVPVAVDVTYLAFGR